MVRSKYALPLSCAERAQKTRMEMKNFEIISCLREISETHSASSVRNENCFLYKTDTFGCKLSRSLASKLLTEIQLKLVVARAAG